MPSKSRVGGGEVIPVAAVLSTPFENLQVPPQRCRGANLSHEKRGIHAFVARLVAMCVVTGHVHHFEKNRRFLVLVESI